MVRRFSCMESSDGDFDYVQITIGVTQSLSSVFFAQSCLLS
jgi:hypothetical protein